MSKKTIYQSILEVRKKLKGVTKNGTNDFHGYKYATINDVIHEVRDAVNEVGLLFIPSKIEDIESSKGDTVESFTITYKVINEDGQSLDVVLRAAGEDKGDKKAYKANTGALKYLFIQLFMLPTDADPENDKNPNLQPGSSAQVAPPAAPSKNLPWLTNEQFNKAMSADIKGLTAVFNNENKTFKIGKDKRTQLLTRLKELKNN